MRALVPLLLILLLAASLPAWGQDLLSGESKSESSSDVLQKLLLGKVKEKSATATGGTKAAPMASDRLPRKAAGTASASQPTPDSPAKPARTIKPRPTRQADLRPTPRL